MHILHALKEVLTFITSIFFLIFFGAALFALGYSVGYLPEYMGEPYFGVPFYIAIPFPILLFSLYSLGAYIWYLILTLTIVSGTIAFLYFDIFPYYRDFVRKPFAYRHNAFQYMVELFSLSIFMSILIYTLASLMGGNPKVLPVKNIPFYAQMLELLHAAVYEELITRVLFLGIPVFLVYRLSGKKISPFKIFGGFRNIGGIEATFIIISAAIFGIAHTSAWGLWKAIPAFIAGLALGFLFAKYGIYASILLHFVNDYIAIPIHSGPMQLTFGILLFYFIAVGAVYTVSYAIHVYHFFVPPKTKKVEEYAKKRTAIQQSTLPPPPWSTPWISIKCPNCGGTEFQYIAPNKLRCVHCGTIIDLSEYQEQQSQSESQENLP